MTGGRRILFLDDDQGRAATFLSWQPTAVWVETAADCVSRLAEPWDEVHLDHDLGGETFVEQDREDCGMAVVRWLCEEFRPHLQPTLFVVHTHNLGAACAMSFQLQATGYFVREAPFGPPQPPQPAKRRRSWLSHFRERWRDIGR
jgi:hypothetical protein